MISCTPSLSSGGMATTTVDWLTIDPGATVGGGLVGGGLVGGGLVGGGLVGGTGVGGTGVGGTGVGGTGVGGTVAPEGGADPCTLGGADPCVLGADDVATEGASVVFAIEGAAETSCRYLTPSMSRRIGETVVSVQQLVIRGSRAFSCSQVAAEMTSGSSVPVPP